MNPLRILIIGLFLISTLNIDAQSEKNESKIDLLLQESVDKMAKSFLKDSLMKSLSIGVYYKGEEFIRHYGELDQGKKNPPTNQTLYDIGSVTKTFVGTLMAKAELEGKLSLDDDIRKYLDGDYPNLEYDKQAIKIRDLLTHTSGLPKFLPLSIMEEFDEMNEDLADRISKISNAYPKQAFLQDLKKIKMDTVPGFKYAYSNAGAELAAYVLERAYGIPFERLLEEQLFKPARMTSSGIHLSKAQEKVYANGYGDFNNLTPAMETPLWGGSGFGKSTIPDLLNYIKYHISDEAVATKSHQVLFDKEIIRGDPKKKIAYMWELNTDDDFGAYISHHGGAFGVQNWMLVFPEEEMGMSIVTNQSGRRTAGKLATVLNGILLELANEKYASDQTETEQITATLLDYIEGSTNGQPKRLEKAFHPDLNLYYNWNRSFKIWSGKAYIEDTTEGKPTGESGEILSIDYVNDIATAKVRISHPEVEIPYIDYFMLMKIKGHWTIIHKMFTKEINK